jgi:Ion channel
VSYAAFLRRNPSAGLLFVQLLGVVLYPLMESSPRGRALFGLFGLLVLALALWVVRSGPWLTWLAVTLAVPVVVLSLAMVVSPSAEIAIATAALEAVFYFYAAGSLIAYMLQDWQVAADELFAAGATFTLLAWAFAYMFVVCQGLQPGAFGYSGDGTAPRSWTELLYCSVAVLSSVGLSDIMPVTPMARALVMLESFAGIMYIALVVSRLVSLAGAARRDRPQP